MGFFVVGALGKRWENSYFFLCFLFLLWSIDLEGARPFSTVEVLFLLVYIHLFCMSSCVIVIQKSIFFIVA